MIVPGKSWLTRQSICEPGNDFVPSLGIANTTLLAHRFDRAAARNAYSTERWLQSCECSFGVDLPPRAFSRPPQDNTADPP